MPPDSAPLLMLTSGFRARRPATSCVTDEMFTAPNMKAQLVSSEPARRPSASKPMPAVIEPETAAPLKRPIALQLVVRIPLKL